MQTSSMNYILSCLDKDTQDIVSGASLRKRLAERSHEYADSHANLLLKQYDAISRAQRDGSPENLQKAADASQAVDDFITAYYWHSRIRLNPEDVVGKYQRFYLENASVLQKRKCPDALPVERAEQMFRYFPAEADELANPDYFELELQIADIARAEYMKYFDRYEQSIIIPAKEADEKKQAKIDKASKIYFYTLGAVWGISTLWLLFDLIVHIKLGNILLFLLITVGLLLLAFLPDWLGLTKVKNADRSRFLYQVRDEVKKTVSSSRPYLQLKQLEETHEGKIPYEVRWSLAALSRITGETRLESLKSLAENGSLHSWLTRSYPKTTQLLRGRIEIDKVVLSGTVYIRECPPMDYEKRPEKDILLQAMFDAASLHRHFSKSIPDAGRLASLLQAFLKHEYEAAEKAGNNRYLGITCYYLYHLFLCTRNDHAAVEYGRIGFPYHEQLQLEVITEAARIEDCERCNPRSLNHDKYFVAEFVQQMKEDNDPRYEQFLKLQKEGLAQIEQERRAESEYRQKLRQEERARIEREYGAEIRRDLNQQADDMERMSNLLFGAHHYLSAEEELFLDPHASSSDYLEYKMYRDDEIERKYQDEIDDIIKRK